MDKDGRPLGWEPKDEADHFVTCTICGESFDMRDLGDHTEYDREGVELPDKHTAWKEAIVVTGQMIQFGDAVSPEQDWRLEVADEFQVPLYVLYIRAEACGNKSPREDETKLYNL